MPFTRRLLVFAVVAGAAITGGAATGTTLALWRDTTPPLNDGQLSAGNLSIAVNKPGITPATVDLGSLSVVQGGDGKAVAAEVLNTSAAGAPHLRFNVNFLNATVASSSTPAMNPSDLNINVVRKGSGDCAPATDNYTSLSTPSAPLNSSPLGYGSLPICISLKALSSARVGAGGKVTLYFQAAQVP